MKAKLVLILVAALLAACDQEPEPSAMRPREEPGLLPTRVEWQIYSAARHRSEYLKFAIPIHERQMHNGLSPEDRVRSERSLQLALEERPAVEEAFEKARKAIERKLPGPMLAKFAAENQMELEYRALRDIERDWRIRSPKDDSEARAKLAAEDDVKASEAALLKVREELSPYLIGMGSPRESIQSAYARARADGVLPPEKDQ